MSLVDLFSLLLQYSEEKGVEEEGDDRQGLDLLRRKLKQWRTLEEGKLEGEHGPGLQEECGVCVHIYMRMYVGMYIHFSNGNFFFSQLLPV